MDTTENASNPDISSSSSSYTPPTPEGILRDLKQDPHQFFQDLRKGKTLSLERLKIVAREQLKGLIPLENPDFDNLKIADFKWDDTSGNLVKLAWAILGEVPTGTSLDLSLFDRKDWSWIPVCFHNICFIIPNCLRAKDLELSEILELSSGESELNLLEVWKTEIFYRYLLGEEKITSLDIPLQLQWQCLSVCKKDSVDQVMSHLELLYRGDLKTTSATQELFDRLFSLHPYSLFRIGSELIAICDFLFSLSETYNLKYTFEINMMELWKSE